MKQSIKKDNTAAGNSPADSRIDNILRDAINLAEAGHPDRALGMLGRININTDAVRNARGVCLLRLGRFEDALRTFRGLVLKHGCTWMRPELPVIVRTNFCTALLLSGHPAGCRDSLREMDEQDHPSVIRLYQALERWQRSLSWLPWLQWKLGSEPDVPVTLEFVPGEFTDPPITPHNAPPKEHPADEAARC